MIRKTEKGPVKKDGANTKSLVFFKNKPAGITIHRLETPDDFDRARFVLKACSRDSAYEIFRVLHVEQTRTGSRLVASDGRRMHVAEISRNIKSGNYKPVVTKDVIQLGEPVEGVRFPDWSKAVPEKTRKRGVINLEHTGLGKDRKQTDRLSLAFNALVKQTGEPVNLRYLEDLTKREWTVYCPSEKRKAVVLRESNAERETFAVFVPLIA
jgi:hypothetical protein